MPRRTTIEINEALLTRAQRALGSKTIRATVEEALRQAADRAETAGAEQAERQLRFLGIVGDLVDLDVLRTEEAWR